ncbi:hypothetical protein FSP39_017819 [Pinctada imbricata]|uniref:Uncharacterized protein n=1 Tax=Pinctada imbricata TaxID=66713 RepID=A0AA88Y1Y8_PINIB|nr:hypothetical protein FSP39_017819 [Pinctada imbricata]
MRRICGRGPVFSQEVSKGPSWSPVVTVSQSAKLLDIPLKWNDANLSCSLVHNTESILGSNVLQNGTLAWIGKRKEFNNWVSLQDCGRFLVTQNQFTKIDIKGPDYVQECQKECLALYPSGNGEFGLQNNGGIECICFGPSPRIQLRVGPCSLWECGINANSDLCAGNGEIVIYKESPSAVFDGSGQCAAFKRNGLNTFEALAIPCNEEHGYMEERTLFGLLQYNPVTSYGNTWTQTAITSGIAQSGSTRLSNIQGVNPAWNSLSLQQWPLNVTLWVALTRRSELRLHSDQTDCYPGSCFCVAVYIDTNGRLEEMLLDCNLTLPALCNTYNLNVRTTHIEVFMNTLSDATSTKGENSRLSPVYLIVGVAIIIIGLLVAPSILYVIFCKWKFGKETAIKSSEKKVSYRSEPEVQYTISTENGYEPPIVPGEDNTYVQPIHSVEANYEAPIHPGEANNYETLDICREEANNERPTSYIDHSYVELIDNPIVEDVTIESNDTKSLIA